MKRVSVDMSKVCDWNSFHDLFSSVFGFPDYYGRNMNAWIDCMEDFGIGDDCLVLELQGMAALKARCPAIYEALNECSAFINFRQRGMAAKGVIALSYGNDA